LLDANIHDGVQRRILYQQNLNGEITQRDTKDVTGLRCAVARLAPTPRADSSARLRSRKKKTGARGMSAFRLCGASPFDGSCFDKLMLRQAQHEEGLAISSS
jgi:hypothetical protein